MKPNLLILSAVIACIFMTNTARAEQKSAPLLLLLGGKDPGGGYLGDLWAWSDAGQPLKQLTNWDHNYWPVISPDGQYVAYDSTPVEGLSELDCGGGWPANNIWVLKISSGNGFRVADQPPNAPFCGTLTPNGHTVVRPRPAWAPDSQSLAWGEKASPSFVPNGPVYRLATYNLAQKSQRVIVPDMGGDWSLTSGRPVDWSEAGIADFSTLSGVLSMYDPDGKLLFKGDPDGGCPMGFNLNGRWVKFGDKTAFYSAGPYPACNHQYLVTPPTWAQTEVTGQLEMYSLHAPDGISVFFTYDKDGNVLWHARAPGQPVKDLDVTEPDPHPLSFDDNQTASDFLTISPDGTQVAYISHNGVLLYSENGQTTPLDNNLFAQQRINWIGWGATGWRIRSPQANPTAEIRFVDLCLSLFVGQSA